MLRQMDAQVGGARVQAGRQWTVAARVQAVADDALLLVELLSARDGLRCHGHRVGDHRLTSWRREGGGGSYSEADEAGDAAERDRGARPPAVAPGPDRVREQ